MEQITKIAVVSLGCAKNQVDAEMMMSKLAGAGYAFVEEPGLADIVLLNTCGFITAAKEEAIEWLNELITLKSEGTIKKIVVTGCLAERYREEFEKEFPEVDAVIGIGRNQFVAEIIEEMLQSDTQIARYGLKDSHQMEGDRILSTLPHYAYLRIADGCDNCCSYCAIPQIRGCFRSRPFESVIEEAKGLAKDGVRELVIIAQDTTRYGLDLYQELRLPKLLRELCKIDGLKWIRLLYAYPERVSDELIDVIASEEKIVKYLDIPIQHCDGKILGRMNRKGDEQSLRELIKKLREKVPGITLRTTFITGFPGETEEQFNRLGEFAEEMRFERMGCFAYSEEEGTPAAGFPEQVDEDEREHRKEILEEQQDTRVAELYGAMIGQTQEVVVEGYDRYLEHYFGRSAMFAPEIDGLIYFTSQTKLQVGEFVSVKLTKVVENNPIGEVI